MKRTVFTHRNLFSDKLLYDRTKNFRGEGER